MPTHLGYSHVSLSVTDREVSSRFYSDVLGFIEYERLTEEPFDEIVMLHEDSGTFLCLQQHHANDGSNAHPARTGADHFALQVGTHEDLEDWEKHLAALGEVTYTPIAERHYGSVLCLRDPDQFQLELFFRENHP